MNRIRSILIVIAAILCLITAVEAKDQFQVVTTIFPEYDWVRNILGENPADAEVTMLLDKGVDLHSYQPTVDDIMKISTCDLFIYVGGESDEWVSDALHESVNEEMIAVNLLELLGDSVKEEEFKEGMQPEEHDHGHDHEADEDHDHEHEGAEHHEEEHDHEHEGAEHHEEEHDHEYEEAEYDEHVWLSLRNTMILCSDIAGKIAVIDPEHAEVYKNNAASYIKKLDDLDKAYETAVAEAPGNTLLFGDRFPFRYLTDDYGLDYYAAFVGCSAETEASFETVIFLTQKVDELSLPAVMTIEGGDHRIAQTIIQNTASRDQDILTMDSMQSKTMKDAADGETYLGIMEKNLEVLKEALR